MIEVLLTAIPSICWLLLRCYRLLQTPAEKLARQLNIDIPYVPIICIDSLDNTNVEFHWDIQVEADESLFYAVIVNGTDVGTLAQTSVKLSNLTADSLYSIQVVAVNSVSNFISRSPNVYVRTSGHDDIRKSAETVEKLQYEKEFQKKIELAADKGQKSHSIAELTSAEVSSITCKSQLTEYLYLSQLELSKVASDHALYTQSQRAEEERLRGEIEAYKKKVSDCSDTRHKREQDLRQLEKQKDSLTFSKLKLTKQLKTLENSRLMQQTKLAELRTRASKLNEKCVQASRSACVEEEKTEIVVKKETEDIKKVKAAISELEASIKTFSSEKKSSLNVMNQLRSLIAQFSESSSRMKSGNDKNSKLGNPNTECFAPDGKLTGHGAKLMHKIYVLQPQWEAELSRELDILHGLDCTWRELFNEKISVFLRLFNDVEIARFNDNHQYTPQIFTEKDACVQFGGPNSAHVKQPIVPTPQNISKKKAHRIFGKNPSSPSPAPSLSLSPPSTTTHPNLDSRPPCPYNGITSSQLPEDSSSVLTPEVFDSTPQSLNTSLVQLPHMDVDRNSLNGPGSISDLAHDSNPSWLDHQSYHILDINSCADSNFEADRENAIFSKGNSIYARGSPVLVSQPTNSLLPGSLPNPCNPYPQYMDTTMNMAPSMLHNSSQNMLQSATLDVTDPLNSPLNPLLQSNYQQIKQRHFSGELTNESRAFTSELQHPSPSVSISSYSNTIGPNFPYSDSLFQPSPTQDNLYLNPQLQSSALTGLTNSLWTNSSQTSFIDTHSLGRDSPRPQPQHQNMAESLASSISHKSTMSADGSLLNSILHPSAPHHSTTKSIWSDRLSGNIYTHDRTISSGSQLWGKEAAAIRREKSPNNGFGKEFSPFSQNTLPSQSGAIDYDNSAEYDIRSL